jgi:hypothetical protein
MDNIVQRIADYADIDTRRALGVFRRLPKSDLNPHPVGHCSWRYWPRERKAIYFDANPYNYEFEVHTGLSPVYDDDGAIEGWQYSEHSGLTSVWKNKRDDYVVHFGPTYCDPTDGWYPVFQFAAMPEFCD